MDFYTNIAQMGDKLLVRGYKNGQRQKFMEKYRPYLFIPKNGGKYKTLDNKSVEKMQFDSISDAKDFMTRYEDVANMEFYGLTTFPYVYIFDNFKGEIS